MKGTSSISETSVRDLDRLSFGHGACISELARAACLLEATAPKPGNVHPGASFGDMHYQHFVDSAMIVGECFERLEEKERFGELGRFVLEIVRTTREKIGVNTNLGIALVIVPLGLAMLKCNRIAACRKMDIDGRIESLRGEVTRVLQELGPEDSRNVFRAIAEANPGGLGQVKQMDVRGEAPESLMEAMSLARDRDQIAQQYTDGFVDCLSMAKRLMELRAFGTGWMQAIVRVQVESLARQGDSLIRRKNDRDIEIEVQRLARESLTLADLGEVNPWGSESELDRYLRADGNRRNPGATADLIAGGLFVALWASCRE